jgi:uncharacterized membrane protein
MRTPHRHALLRLLVMLALGVSAGLATGLAGHWLIAPVIGWAVAAAVFSGWVWLVIARQDAAATQEHATLEDPGRQVADTLVVLLGVASIAAVAVALIPAAQTQGAERLGLAALGLLSIALSWLLLHTLFTLRYARLYYGAENEGGIDFNQPEPPRYSDFAYFSFNLGMTFQVSDTAVTDHRVRATVLQHALLSFVFGTVILATTINLVAGLGS